jgi:hypothetical protein
MQIDFTLKQRVIGTFAATVDGGGIAPVITTESLTSHDGAVLVWRLEELHAVVLADIPNLPPPSLIDNLLVIIRQDLSATAHINDLAPRAMIKVTRDVRAGEPVAVTDIGDITSFDLGIEIPVDAAFVLVRSFGWRRSLFYDFRPLEASAPLRTFDVPAALAQQALTLYTRPLSDEEAAPVASPVLPREVEVGEGLATLSSLLGAQCDVEAKYQELFQEHPWMFGGFYRAIHGHRKFNDANIPDFVGIRHQDECHDIIELKHPFVPCFKQSGGFSSEFNEAWNQAERYLTFARKNADYLAREKGLRFENPRCLLVMGYRFDQQQLRAIRDKESCNLAISVVSYDQLAAMARALVNLMRGAAAEQKP